MKVSTALQMVQDIRPFGWMVLQQACDTLVESHAALRLEYNRLLDRAIEQDKKLDAAQAEVESAFRWAIQDCDQNVNADAAWADYQRARRKGRR